MFTHTRSVLIGKYRLACTVVNLVSPLARWFMVWAVILSLNSSPSGRRVICYVVVLWCHDLTSKVDRLITNSVGDHKCTIPSEVNRVWTDSEPGRSRPVPRIHSTSSHRSTWFAGISGMVLNHSQVRMNPGLVSLACSATGTPITPSSFNVDSTKGWGATVTYPSCIPAPENRTSRSEFG